MRDAGWQHSEGTKDDAGTPAPETWPEARAAIRTGGFVFWVSLSVFVPFCIVELNHSYFTACSTAGYGSPDSLLLNMENAGVIICTDYSLTDLHF